MKPSDFEVGQVLWRDSSSSTTGNRRSRNALRQCRVLKVGRKWVQVSYNLEKDFLGRPDRFDPSIVSFRGIGFPLDGGDYRSPGTIYLDPDEWHALAERDARYSLVQEKFRSFNSDHVSLEQLRDVCKTLEINYDSIR